MGVQDENGPEQAPIRVEDLVEVCGILNAAGVRYLVYGGMACVLHGHVRTTMDVDICLGEDAANIEKALKALSVWGLGYARQATVQDVLDNVVLKISDRIPLDISSKIWKVDWDKAWSRRRVVEVNGEGISFLSRTDLIQSKRTYREFDVGDVLILRALRVPEPGRPAAGDE